MKRKFSFDPAWIIFLIVAATLVALRFVDDEQSRNKVAGVILLTVALLFVVMVLLRTLTNWMR